MVRTVTRSFTSRPVSGLLAAAALIAALSVSACSSAEPAGGPAATAAAAGKPPVAVSVVTVAQSPLEDGIEVVGTLEPKFAADIKSEVTATVAEVFVTEWVPVRKGDKLARFDTSETEASIAALRAVEAQARVSQTRAERELARAKELKQYGLITSQDLDEAQSAVEAATAGVAAAAAQVKTAQARLAKSLLLSPMDGVIALRGVNVGDRVENMGSSDPLFRVVDNRLLNLTVSVPSTRLAEVRVGQTLVFTSDSLPGRSFSGRVMFINPSIDPASRSARVIAEVPNTDRALRGGAFAQGRILLATRPSVVQVPREALLNWNLEQRTAEVFVVSGENASRRQVTTGLTTAGAVEIVKGLAIGDRVVTRGGFAIREGDRVAVAQAEAK
jgi:membrane fusion protein (multidrug efflux system)